MSDGDDPDEAFNMPHDEGLDEAAQEELYYFDLLKRNKRIIPTGRLKRLQEEDESGRELWKKVLVGCRTWKLHYPRLDRCDEKSDETLPPPKITRRKEKQKKAEEPKPPSMFCQLPVEIRHMIFDHYLEEHRRGPLRSDKACSPEPTRHRRIYPISAPKIYSLSEYITDWPPRISKRRHRWRRLEGDLHVLREVEKELVDEDYENGVITNATYQAYKRYADEFALGLKTYAPILSKPLGFPSKNTKGAKHNKQKAVINPYGVRISISMRGNIYFILPPLCRVNRQLLGETLLYALGEPGDKTRNSDLENLTWLFMKHWFDGFPLWHPILLDEQFESGEADHSDFEDSDLEGEYERDYHIKFATGEGKGTAAVEQFGDQNRKREKAKLERHDMLTQTNPSPPRFRRSKYVEYRSERDRSSDRYREPFKKHQKHSSTPYYVGIHPSLRVYDSERHNIRGRRDKGKDASNKPIKEAEGILEIWMRYVREAAAVYRIDQEYWQQETYAALKEYRKFYHVDQPAFRWAEDTNPTLLAEEAVKMIARAVYICLRQKRSSNLVYTPDGEGLWCVEEQPAGGVHLGFYDEGWYSDPRCPPAQKHERIVVHIVLRYLERLTDRLYHCLGSRWEQWKDSWKEECVPVQDKEQSVERGSDMEATE
ncbi:hypothetical protein M011DRAFT_462648 [Sporormia fimetaria CBS 119925]|uniref:Uncharacterized protein n=1 Tax=Sporormia fimetaria CBS 119925 TaxID=1340428 RepID=A0A6A6UXJ2_9PLEO|nr:hypothetical protein M011DRAFT_462648 [Sporormia fimetaria CBS 119925]